MSTERFWRKLCAQGEAPPITKWRSGARRRPQPAAVGASAVQFIFRRSAGLFAEF
jgi:hypothetical protein